MHVVATAGHVDHGKSTLVLALTGMDPDRFAEEKARGLTIDLGFAWTTLPSGRELAFVDVPGHVRFIRNMLAGVGAVDACLFVVAATESWKPQSEEHLRILSVLGVRHGLIALTKVGLVDDEWQALARMEIEERVAGTFLEAAEIIGVDAPTNVGLDDLRAALDRLLANTPTAVDQGRPRLWVDRSFAAKGSGTVVTGTLAGGKLHVDDELLLLEGGKGARVRVRALQSHQRAFAEVGPGHRLAVNLTGISHDEVMRGHALVRPGQWAPTRTVDASLDVLASLDHDVSRRGAYELYVGSGEHAIRLRVLGAAAISRGQAGLARLHLPVELPLLPGDRYVLRESGRSETVGGGEVLDVAPVLPASKARPSRSVERVVEERGWVDVDELERLTGSRRTASVGRWVVDPAALTAAGEKLMAAVSEAGSLGLDLAGLTDRQRAVLVDLDGVVVEAGRAWPAGAASKSDADAALASDPWLAQLRAAPWTPPDPGSAGVDRQVVRELVRRGLVIERDGAYFASEAIADAGRVVARLLADAPEGVTVAAVRDALQTTRKHVLPILAHLDATGVTRRRGDVRIAGPRLPEI
ncbi:MAG TPA: selenocysteine-specific translation elongation factor [Acidimicrobiales bacterium]|nr:selenocysteine-specific translation elongation factor [Acidimicrobiales bacterium]